MLSVQAADGARSDLRQVARVRNVEPGSEVFPYHSPDSDGSAIKPIRVVVKLKNNAIIERRERLGYENCAAFCRAMGFSNRYSEACQYEAAKLSPFAKNGELKAVPHLLCEALAATPEELWPDEVLAIQKTTVTRLLDGHDVRALPGFSVAVIDERSVEQKVDDVSVAERALGYMRERDAYVVRRVLFDQATLEEVGEEMRLSRERIRGLLRRGLDDARRKLSRAEAATLRDWEW